MDALVDRRIFERMVEDFTGWYTLKDKEEILGEFLGLDFSAGGLRVNSRQQILEARALNLSLVSSRVNGPIGKTALVVWQREINPGWWQSGLKFFQPDFMRLWPLVRSEQYQED